MENLEIIKPIETQITELEDQIREMKKELSALRKKVKPVEIENYFLTDLNGNQVSLQSLFQEKEELLLIFNMGKSCRWCTLWADGFNGLTSHLQNRVSFALISPDNYKEAKEFATSRDWKFNILIDADSPFRETIGLKSENGITPAAATFSMDDSGKIYLRTISEFGPGDNFCVMYDLLDLLPKGYNNWAPHFSY